MNDIIGIEETFPDNSTYLWRHIVKSGDEYVCNRKDFDAREWREREELIAQVKDAAGSGNDAKVDELMSKVDRVGASTAEGRFKNSREAIAYFLKGHENSSEHSYRAHMFVAGVDPSLGHWKP